MSDVKTLEDFKPQYGCSRFYPIDGWHEVGCSDRSWSKTQLQEALDNAKQSNAYLAYLLHESQKKESKSKMKGGE